ncbi:MAG: prephenate dehydrogenase/arogenate dehydrogenase family protein [Thermodesulfobacteriota bacterium]
MKNIEIGIIGGTGGMGKWFADFFKEEGYPVFVAGRKTGMDIPTMVKRCPVVIVSVPISSTCEVIERVGPYMKKESLLTDLTSLKGEPVRSMLKSSVSEIIGLHPLFGPAADSIAGHKIAICPVRAEKWLDWLKDILTKNGADMIETTPERHDELMALVQVLNHLNSMTMGIILGESGVDLAELKRFATPLFNTKLGIIEKVFTNNPRLYAEIVTLNPNIHKILDRYGKTLSHLKSLINRRKTETLTKLIQERSIWES